MQKEMVSVLRNTSGSSVPGGGADPLLLMK